MVDEADFFDDDDSANDLRATAIGVMARHQVYDFEEFFRRSSSEVFGETSLMTVYQSLPKVHVDGPWLAGGAIRKTLLDQALDSDIDYFFKNADQLEKFCKDLEAIGLIKSAETKHAVTYEGNVGVIAVKVQAIRFKYYANLAEVIDSFDYTICQFGWDGMELRMGEFSLWDLGRRKLAIHKITYPVSTMRRMLKYTRQGFTACAGCMQAILRETATKTELLNQLDVEYVD